jgi:hypothetical protein
VDSGGHARVNVMIVDCGSERVGDDQANKYSGVLLERSQIVDDQTKKQSECYFDFNCNDPCAEKYTT